MSDDRPEAWGYPRATTWHTPAAGDVLLDTVSQTAGWFTSTDGNEHQFLLEDGRVGHVRMSATCDGLYRHVDRSERDGFKLVLVCDLPPGASRRVWRLE